MRKAERDGTRGTTGAGSKVNSEGTALNKLGGLICCTSTSKFEGITSERPSRTRRLKSREARAVLAAI